MSLSELPQAIRHPHASVTGHGIVTLIAVSKGPRNVGVGPPDTPPRAMTQEADIEQGDRSRSRSRDNPHDDPHDDEGQGQLVMTGMNTPSAERTEIILAAQAVEDTELWDSVMVELQRMANWQRALRLYILILRYWRLLLAHPERVQHDRL